MSWSHSFTVWCDAPDCLVWYQGEENLYRSEVWKIAAAWGWRRRDGKMYCPKCSDTPK